MSTEPDEKAGGMTVEVAYATPAKQVLIQLEVQAGCTVGEAIEQSGVRQAFPGLTVDPGALGIFSRKVPPEHPLRDGDRVEIYRPLQADPKETRRRRAKKS
jgi:putative ubiquitin-RnfH superfamily antitoxin RatB of RatAB toxin-antitoxin module